MDSPTSPVHSLVASVRAHVTQYLGVTQQGDEEPEYPRLVMPLDATPLVRIVKALGLSESEHAVLWLLISHELCPRTRLMIREQNTEQLADPTIDTVRRLVHGMKPSLRAWNELAERSPLRRFVLVERTDGSGETPEHRQTVKASRRAISLALGDEGIDPEIRAHVAMFDGAPLDELLYDGIPLGDIERVLRRGEGLVVASGRAGIGRRSILAGIARQHGHRVVSFDARSLDREINVARRQLRILARECALLEAVPLVQNIDTLQKTGDDPDRCDLLGDELGGLVLATSTSRIVRRWKRAPAWFELPAPPARRLVDLWQRALPAADAEDVQLLASLYPLAPALIDAAGRSARERCLGDQMRAEHVEAGIRSVVDDRLEGLATRLQISQTWQDLVLPQDQEHAVAELMARVRCRHQVYDQWGFAQKVGKGLGIVALFSGPPGTGKTMCAGLIAKELGLAIYQVDISKLVSKWIGETEKNLARLFDAAESAHAMLLFDEADSIFGKRTEVKSSNDRNANQETNYLLQRIESFSGVCILTTNHVAAMDEAFRRRIAVHVRLPMPDVHERERLWKAMLPANAAVDRDVRFGQLANHFAMSGGYIRNAVLRAAFLAADEGSAIAMRHLNLAARLESEASGKLTTNL